MCASAQIEFGGGRPWLLAIRAVSVAGLSEMLSNLLTRGRS